MKKFKNKVVIPGNGRSPYTGFVVFRAYDNELDRNVVVKCGKKPKNLHKSIIDEFAVLKNLDHLGIVKPLDCVIIAEDGLECMVMPDYPIGGRRSRWRDVFKEATEDQCSVFIKNMLSTLDYLREKSVLNEDVEMANIVATHPWNPILIDFGRVRIVTYLKEALVHMLHPDNNTRINAWVRELCGIGGKYEEEGSMVNFDIRNLIIKELQRI